MVARSRLLTVAKWSLGKCWRMLKLAMVLRIVEIKARSKTPPLMWDASQLLRRLIYGLIGNSVPIWRPPLFVLDLG